MKTIGKLSSSVDITVKGRADHESELYYSLEIDTGQTKVKIPVVHLHMIGKFLCECAIRAQVDTGVPRKAIEDFYTEHPQEWGIKWSLPYDKPASD